MKIKEIKCKTALSPSSLPGLDYSLNPYRGCQHNCAYCYVPNILHIKRNKWGCFVDVKTNMPIVLSRELRKKNSGVVGISTVTDPYQPVEKKYRVTRFSLKQILLHDFPICIQSKSNLILRDVDIISKFSKVEIMMSIATLNDYERKLLEPYSSSINERLEVLKQFSNIGIKTSVFFGPIFPTIMSENISEIIDIFAEYGVSEIMIDKFNLKPGIKKNIELTIYKYRDLYYLFSKNVFQKNDFFTKIRETMFESSKDKKVKIIDAFN
jgi:DNA repair photolyase